ncbi:MAG: ATP-NAD kinase [Candidatus Rokuibacteriota bacterium]|nr:MAG: ATP-NAD kinase [Candidatus Rokubacteria bacterium]
MTTRSSPTSWIAGSRRPLPSAVRRAAVLTHGKPETIGPGLSRLAAVARAAGVELLLPREELEKHGLDETPAELERADLVIVLGGDGTMLRALQRLLGTGVAAIGVNFGRVGFLASVGRDQLEEAMPRVFAGGYEVAELPTLEVELEETRAPAVNDVVCAHSQIGRMVELSWSVGGEDLGRQACDGILCSSPSGSTAYNLSNGGPVLVWGLDAMAVTFIAPHSLDARPLVVPRGLDLVIGNETPDVPVTVLADGHALGDIPPAGRAVVRLGEPRSLLAVLPEATFFLRYRQTFRA